MDLRSVKNVLCDIRKKCGLLDRHQEGKRGLDAGPMPTGRQVRRYDKGGVNNKKGKNKNIGCASGFTLVELLIYAVIFTIASALLTGILVTISTVQTKENAAFEVTRQLQFVTQKIQYAIRDASIVDATYEGSDPGTPCATHCSVRLRVSDPLLDPTIISSDINGVYIKEGDNPQVTITSPNIKITSLIFNKIGNPGGLSTVTMSVALVYNAADPALQIAKSLNSAIAHVSAATFDTDLLPDASESRSIGGSSLKWKDLTVSSGVTVSGVAGVGEFAGFTMSKSTTHGTTSINEYYVTSTPYDKYGQRYDVGGTPVLYLEGDINQTGRRAYFLNGNVGVGGSSPANRLQIEGSSGADVTLAIRATGTTNGNVPNISLQSTEAGGLSAKAVIQAGQVGASSAGYLSFGTRRSDSLTEAVRIDNNGNVGIGTTSPGSYRLYVSGGDAYFSGDVSALSFTDRTPYPENIGVAYAAVMSMRRLPDGEYQAGNREQQLDHSTLTDFVRGSDGNRDLSATVSAQNEVIKDLIRRIEILEGR